MSLFPMFGSVFGIACLIDCLHRFRILELHQLEQLLRILERDILIYNRCTTKIAKNTPRLFYLANGYALVLGIGFDGIVLWVELPDKWGYAVETHIRDDLETI